eukprot:Lankesteria_metandrocarpae@DN10602_c0_g1_i1.p1
MTNASKNAAGSSSAPAVSCADGCSLKATCCCVMETLASYQKSFYLGCYGVLLGVMVITNIVVLPVPLQMVLYTFPILHIGSHLSLKLNDVDEETGERVPVEAVTRKDAMLFPLIGSAALSTLYFVYKFLSAYWVNLLLGLYLTVVGIAAIGESIYAFVDECVTKESDKPIVNREFTVPAILHKLIDPKIKIKFSFLQLVCYIAGLVLASLWLYSKHWVFHNILAVGFAIQAIRLISVGDFTTATILLCGLFVYDIFWVFGTEVMVTVAKSFEGPAKIIFPVSLNPYKQSILGLGDVVIPGVFVAMILRFDKWRFDQKADNGTPTKAVDKKRPAVDIHSRFPKCYYAYNMVAYQCGLMTTTLVMYTFKAAQPALLYLVPFCLLGLFGPALYRNELSVVTKFTEEETKNTTTAAANGALADSKADSPTATSSSTAADSLKTSVRSRKPQKEGEQ